MTDDREKPPLIEFLLLLALALVRKKLTGQQAGIALFVALTSHGTTGERATIDIQHLAVETGLSERQVWRHFKTLVAAGWFDQTHAPARGSAGERGRRARYRLTLPALDLSLVSRSERVTPTSAEMSHGAPVAAETSDTFGSERLTLSVETCDVVERENGTVTPTDVTPTDGSPRLGNNPAATTDRADELEALTPDGAADRDTIHLKLIADARQAMADAKVVNE